MNDVDIRVIPHKTQRYETCGDYWRDEYGDLQVRVSFMRDWRFESLVAVHEVIEALICKQKNISYEDIDAFDTDYELRREMVSMEGAYPQKLKDAHKRLFDIFKCDCFPTEGSEPGDDPHAPYYTAHQVATAHERQLAASLNVDWDEYDREVGNL